jgi:hypothetical protein
MSRKKYKKNSFFVGVLKVKNENSRIRIRIHRSEIRIRTKMTQIHTHWFPVTLQAKEDGAVCVCGPGLLHSGRSQVLHSGEVIFRFFLTLAIENRSMQLLKI